MTYVFSESSVGHQAIAVSSTVQNHRLGSIRRAADATLGGGEFIYLKGVVNTIVGSGVTYDDSFQTALASIALNTPRPVAIAMSANGATGYGWYQISGVATVAKANTTSFAKAAALGITSGLAVAAATGLELIGALVAVVASAKSDVTTVKVMVNRPNAPAAGL